jgi:hypothetical protein
MSQSCTKHLSYRICTLLAIAKCSVVLQKGAEDKEVRERSWKWRICHVRARNPAICVIGLHVLSHPTFIHHDLSSPIISIALSRKLRLLLAMSSNLCHLQADCAYLIRFVPTSCACKATSRKHGGRAR